MADLRTFTSAAEAAKHIVTLDSGGGGLEDGEGNKIPLKVQTNYQVISSTIFSRQGNQIELKFTSGGQVGLLYVALPNSNIYTLFHLYVPTSGNILTSIIGSRILEVSVIDNRRLHVNGFSGAGGGILNMLSGNLEIESITDV